MTMNTACFIGNPLLMRTSSRTMPLGGTPLLSIRGLTVEYSARNSKAMTPALHQIDLDLRAGEIVGILGESGAGKSTLAAAILRMLPDGAKSAGAIYFQDEDLQELTESRCRTIRGARIARIVQEPGLCLNPVMRVGDQIAEVIRAHRHVNSGARKAECEAMLHEVGFRNVERVYKAYPHQLSGGELHRIAIAQALVCRPSLVIADEPTRSLDVTAQAEILGLLRETHRKFHTALIFITHNPALLAGFADRVVILYAGRIVEEGPVAQVFRNPFHPYTKGLLELLQGRESGSGGTETGRLAEIPGSLTDADHRNPGCIFEPRCSLHTAVCRESVPPEEFQEDRRVSCFHHAH